MSIWLVQITKLPPGVVLAGDMLQQNISEIFKDLQNVFGITNDNLIIGYHTDGRNHDRTLKQEMQIWH